MANKRAPKAKTGAALSSPAAISAKKHADNASAKAKRTETVEEMVVCRAVDRKGEPVLLERWRYDLLKQAILNVVPADDIGLMYKQLTPAVRANLSRADRQRLGTLHRDTTLVKLDLEFHGDLERIEGMRPQYLRRVEKARRANGKKSAAGQRKHV